MISHLEIPDIKELLGIILLLLIALKVGKTMKR